MSHGSSARCHHFTLKMDANSIHSYRLRGDHLVMPLPSLHGFPVTLCFIFVPITHPQQKPVVLLTHESRHFSAWNLEGSPSIQSGQHCPGDCPIPAESHHPPPAWVLAVASGSLSSVAVPLMSQAHSCLISSLLASSHPPPLSLCSKVSLSDIISPQCTVPPSPSSSYSLTPLILQPHTPAPIVPHPYSYCPTPLLHIAVSMAARSSVPQA